MGKGDTMYQLELKGITHHYNGRTVLNVEHLPIKKGRAYALVGPNGAGKTTLLHIMSLIIWPDRGDVFLEGARIGQDESERIRARRSMTVVLQNPYLFNATVRANVEYGLKARGMEKRKREQRVGEALDQVGLSDFTGRKARQLSGGEAQLVALARGLVLRPSMLFLDEITANLDVKHVRQLERVIKEINRDLGTTIVMTTHILPQAYRLADQVFSLFEGRIVPSGMYNLFAGEFRREGKELFFDTGGIQIHVAQEIEKMDKGYISVNPEDIIVSKDRLFSSARNTFPGKITKIIEQDGAVHLEVEAKETFRVQITKLSFHEMGLTLGSRVFLIFKASSVHVL
jgi:tungstate transport system ATP-binding protein